MQENTDQKNSEYEHFSCCGRLGYVSPNVSELFGKTIYGQLVNIYDNLLL